MAEKLEKKPKVSFKPFKNISKVIWNFHVIDILVMMATRQDILHFGRFFTSQRRNIVRM
jgi:hypothetical protein